MKAFLFALICCSHLAWCGCNANRPSPKNHYYTDYVVSLSYVLQQPVFYSTKDSILSRIGDGGPGAFPMTLEEFQKKPAAWDAVFLPKGTIFKIGEIKYTSSFDAGPYIWITADIFDGKLAGKKCLLNFISKTVHKDNPLIDVPMIDTNFLEVISNP